MTSDFWKKGQSSRPTISRKSDVQKEPDLEKVAKIKWTRHVSPLIKLVVRQIQKQSRSFESQSSTIFDH
jgi:hypothetical protein